MARLTAILLAAGRSLRMGEEKLFLPFQNQPILQHVYQALAATEIDECLVVCNPHTEAQIQDMLDEKVTVIRNPNFNLGMTSSIQTGVQAAKPTDGYMICLGDQPLIRTEDYQQVIHAFKKQLQQDHQAITVPCFQGKRGNPVVFSSAYKLDILNHTEPEGCKAIVQHHQQHVMEVPFHTSIILRDVDTPQDYQDLLG